MKILFDQGTPVPLRRALHEHDTITAFERGWHVLQNGDLLNAPQADGFAAVITTDQSLRYQQNLPERQVAIVVLMTTNWRLISQHTDHVARAIAALASGAYIELHFPPQ